MLRLFFQNVFFIYKCDDETYKEFHGWWWYSSDLWDPTDTRPGELHTFYRFSSSHNCLGQMVPRAVTPLSCSLPASREGATLRPSLHFNFQPFSTSLISRRREESVLCPPGKCSVEDLDIFWTPSWVSTYSKQVLAVVVVVVVEMLMLQQQNSDDQQRSHSDVATPKYFLGHQTLSLISHLPAQ